jgi:membrane protein YqaA with SNARE-associated domain
MNTGLVHAELVAISGHAFRRWFFRLGGIGLIPLGLLDSSVIPIPGSMDVLTIVLAARQQNLWFYYALMATAGSVLGALLTYRLARRGGKKALDRRLRRWHMDKVKKMFQRCGFSAVAVPALMPPPVPMVPFVLAAGVMQYPVKKFVGALLVGRAIRYVALAYLAARFGRKILHPSPAIWIISGVLVTAALLTLFLWREIGRHEPSRAN